MTPNTDGQYVNGTCYSKPIVPLCTGNGHVMLNFGAPEYIGQPSLPPFVLLEQDCHFNSAFRPGRLTQALQDPALSSMSWEPNIILGSCVSALTVKGLKTQSSCSSGMS